MSVAEKQLWPRLKLYKQPKVNIQRWKVLGKESRGPTKQHKHRQENQMPIDSSGKHKTLSSQNIQYYLPLLNSMIMPNYRYNVLNSLIRALKVSP